MEYRSLEIKVISAKDLKNVNLISKMDVYVAVSISGDPKTEQKTTVDRNGNTNPTWNFPMKFTVDESATRQNRLNLVFTLRCDRNLGDKDIGEVTVPVKELIGSIDEGKLQFLTYQVRRPSGRPKGELNFSYKWGEKIARAVAPPPASAHLKAEEPVTAYPAPVVGTSSSYPPPPYMATASSSPYPPQGGYPPPPASVYPPPPVVAGYGYPPPPPYGGYPPGPPPPGYGYQSQPGYGYPPVQQPAKKKNSGLGLGAGLLGGALGGLLIGDMISDSGGGGCGGGCGGGGCGGGF
ncbi:DNA-directed RNA polymerase [Sarracenia purpurea var. burkii]